MTKVCVSAADGSLDARIDPRFGRCAYFVIVDPDTMECHYLHNKAAVSSHGAGIQAAQTVVNESVQVVITGIVGPRAHRVLSAAGVEVVTGATGTVRESIQMYTSGQLRGMQETL